MLCPNVNSNGHAQTAQKPHFESIIVGAMANQWLAIAPTDPPDPSSGIPITPIPAHPTPLNQNIPNQ
jgi:hypothetical protein